VGAAVVGAAVVGAGAAGSDGEVVVGGGVGGVVAPAVAPEPMAAAEISTHTREALAIIGRAG
jgi:hypothetical protein